MKKNRLMVFFGILALLVVAAIVLSLPPVWSRVSFRAQALFTDIKYKLSPPEKAVFVPGQSTPDTVATSVQSTLNALLPSATPDLSTPVPTPLPTSTPIPLPSSAYLKGIKPEQQMYNNCGPATLSMYLSYWKWKGTQSDIAVVVKPYLVGDRRPDKNVMPYELESYLNEHTDFQVFVRMGGDLIALKALVSNGFPVMVEKGFEPVNLNEGWMGHYNLVIGYDDSKQSFITQDSYLLIQKKDWETSPGFEVSYTAMENNWRAFNNIFLVVFPADKGNEVLNLLGPLANETNAWQIAYDRAVAETTSMTDTRDKFFAWFNVGTSLVYLKDYAGASAAYDSAFTIYPSIPEKTRPWRMLWYQTGPYFAYYYSARYQDVINLADTTLSAMGEPILEESYYWRAMAEVSLGNDAAAIDDLKTSLKYHEGFIPSVTELQQLGVTP